MRRPRWFRLITTLWALWFTAILAQPAPLMACLMRVAMGTRAADMPGMSSMPGDAAMHHGTQGTQGRHGSPIDPSCVHLGACCCAPVLTAPADVVPRIEGAAIRIVRVSIPTRVSLTPPPAQAHARPFAIGPPVTLV